MKISGTATGEVEEIEEIGKKDLIFDGFSTKTSVSEIYYPSGWRVGT